MAFPIHATPYKGPESFQPEDAHLFFGRDRAADELASRVLASSVTLVHARSGAGKTSLLNAAVIPRLEARGWHVVTARLMADPGAAVREATSRQLLPVPEAELAAVRRALDALDLTPVATIDKLLRRLGRLSESDVRRRQLLAPVSTTGLAKFPERVTPMFVRLFRRSIDIWRFAEHIAALRGAVTAPPLGLDTAISDVLDALSSPEVRVAHETLERRLHEPATLRPFFSAVTAEWGSRHPRFGLVLVLDQFEEMFTRFVDRGPGALGDARDWRTRDGFFSELGELSAVACTGGPTSLPLHLVLSIRDDFLGQLDALRAFIPSFDASAYHLSPLTTDGARLAVTEPARRFGAEYAGEVVNRLIDALAYEDRFIEPMHLQLVCERLWEVAIGNGQLPEISPAVYEQLGGVQGILHSFVGNILAHLALEDRDETLRMLDLLVTRAGRRDIIAWDRLVHAPGADAHRRVELLHRLMHRAIIRVEFRLGERFVELTHDLLTDPVRRVLAEQPSEGVRPPESPPAPPAEQPALVQRRPSLFRRLSEGK